MPTMKFKIGDKVKYVSGRHGDSEVNPLWGGEQGKIKGTIVLFKDDGWIDVKWDNGIQNCYVERDLVLFKKGKEIKEKKLSPKVMKKLFIKSLVSYFKTRAKRQDDAYKHDMIELSELKKIKRPPIAVKSRIDILKRSQKPQKTKPLNAQHISKELTAINKIPQVKKVKITPTELIIFTKPLMTRNKFFGVYQITIPLDSLDGLRRIHIANLYRQVDGRLDHWYVEYERPCFGGWEYGIQNYLRNGSFYLGVESIIKFLESPFGTRGGYKTYTQFMEELARGV
jgi:hypothetical protein